MTMWYNATVESVAVAASQEAANAAVEEHHHQLAGLPAAELGMADESTKQTWMETLAAGTPLGL